MDHVSPKKNISRQGEEQMFFCHHHLRHLEYVYSDGICLCSFYKETDMFVGSKNACKQLWECVEDMEQDHRCHIQMPIINQGDFYQVSACSLWALRGNANLFRDNQRNHELLFLRVNYDGNWACSIRQKSLQLHFNASCENFLDSYCGEIAKCLLETERTAFQIDLREKVLFNDLPIISLGPWRLSHSRSFCEENVKEAFLDVVDHLGFPNHVVLHKARGLSLCHWSPYSEDKPVVNSVKDMVGWFRVVRLQCNDLRACLQSFSFNTESCSLQNRDPSKNVLLEAFVLMGRNNRLLTKYFD